MRFLTYKDINTFQYFNDSKLMNNSETQWEAHYVMHGSDNLLGG